MLTKPAADSHNQKVVRWRWSSPLTALLSGQMTPTRFHGGSVCRTDSLVSQSCIYRRLRAGTRILGLQNYMIVGLGGFLGAVARFWLAEFIALRMGGRFPYGTFLINCSGSFALGVVVTVLDHYAHWTPNWRYLLPIGFIGAYTTFSTFELETLQSMQKGQVAVAAANVVLSVLLGLACVYAGVVTGKSVVGMTSSPARVGMKVPAKLESTRVPDLGRAGGAEMISAD